MTYDPVDTNDDGTVEADVDNQSVSTEVLSNGVAGSGNSVNRLFGERIDTLSASGDAELSITDLDGAYPRYVIDLETWRSDKGTTLRLQVSTDGGSTWKSGASDYKWCRQESLSNGTDTFGSSNGDSSISVLPNMGSADAVQCGEINIYHAPDPDEFTIVGTEMPGYNKDDRFVYGSGGGVYTSAETVDAVRLFPSGGDVNSAAATLYGVMF